MSTTTTTTQEEENYTEEEIQQVLRDLIPELEAEDESLRENRKIFLVQLLKHNGITIVSKMVDGEVHLYVRVEKKN
jgi:hypothetical protein